MEIIITILIMLVVFLVCREIVCWYWKMNEIVKVLNETKTVLKNIAIRIHKIENQLT